MEEDRYIRIGVLTRAHGVNGALICRLDFPENPEVSTPIIGQVGFSRSTAHSIEVERLEPLNGGNMLCRFAGTPNPESARRFLDMALWLPEQGIRYREPLASPGLVGWSVESEEGEPLGSVVGIIRTAGHPVLEVEGEAEKWLLPGVNEFVVDSRDSDRTLVVRLIPGLRESDDEAGQRESDNG